VAAPLPPLPAQKVLPELPDYPVEARPARRDQRQSIEPEHSFGAYGSIPYGEWA